MRGGSEVNRMQDGGWRDSVKFLVVVIVFSLQREI